MSLKLLFKDELKGFYKSKGMLILWIGLPLLVIIIHLWGTQSEGMPLTTLSAITVSSLGGTLAAVILAVSMINEREKKVYDLFLIRPIKRRNLLFGKFLAVYVCISIAGLLALVVGLIVDYVQMGGPTSQVLINSGESMVTSLSMMAISSSAGILIGVLAPSVLAGAILVIYGANQISILPALPAMLELGNQVVFTVIIGAIFTAVLMSISIVFFDRKQF